MTFFGFLLGLFFAVLTLFFKFIFMFSPCLRFISLLQAGLGLRLGRHILEETSKGRVRFHMFACITRCVEFCPITDVSF